MDLVPAYPFNANFWVSDREIPDSNPENIIWHAIPKPLKSESCKINRSFITSYAILERDIISSLNNFKSLIRIFKKLRDTRKWLNLKSYYIKTVFLHHYDEMKENKSYWNQPLHELFLIVCV